MALFLSCPARAMDLSHQRRSTNFEDRGVGGPGRIVYFAEVSCEEGHATRITATNDRQQTLRLTYSENKDFTLYFRRPQLLGTYSSRERTIPGDSAADRDSEIWEATREFFNGYSPLYDEAEEAHSLEAFQRLEIRAKACCLEQGDGGPFRVHDCTNP